MGEVRFYRSGGSWKEALSRNPSRLELGVAAKLQKAGVRFTTQTPIHVTSADFQIPLRDGKMLLVFLDGPPHRGREDKDAEVRSLLSRRGYEILELAYDRYSSRECDLAVDAIASFLATH